ncbi:hypothetical protein GCM10010331_28470 [Streptomyces xanthochromogenes]|uniref:hypothetical protein n=1 Tax=Streptomyces TaxID=1883 RepID=UPI00141E18E3|nr:MULTISPECIES: hypothetical protein [Streptomyces]GHB39162.1 hypothetical protein GCM10010331_28470 [Streptomyces xanthochromogenes]
MYLVHVRLDGPAETPLPCGAAALLMGCADPDDGLEHVSVAPDGAGGPVLGLFLVAPSLVVAERVAATVCTRALARHSPLAPFRMASCGVVLIPEYWDMLASPAPLDGIGHNMFRPPDSPSGAAGEWAE